MYSKLKELQFDVLSLEENHLKSKEASELKDISQPEGQPTPREVLELFQLEEGKVVPGQTPDDAEKIKFDKLMEKFKKESQKWPGLRVCFDDEGGQHFFSVTGKHIHQCYPKCGHHEIKWENLYNLRFFDQCLLIVPGLIMLLFVIALGLGCLLFIIWAAQYVVWKWFFYDGQTCDDECYERNWHFKIIEIFRSFRS